MDERPTVVVIPTELERKDAFWDIGVLATTGIILWNLQQSGVLPFWLLVVCCLPVTVWSLSGEPAADVGFIGPVATLIRSMLGQRRAHEWLLAWWHFYGLAVYPVWRAWCLSFLNSSLRRTTQWLRLLSGLTRCRPSRAYSWASAYRPNWFPRRVR